jgi:hypothetical protein
MTSVKPMGVSLDHHPGSSPAALSSPPILFLVVISIALLSFIPLLAIAGPGDLPTLYRESRGIVRGDRALFKDTLKLLHECNVASASQTARLADHKTTNQQLDSLKVHAVAVVQQLLESDGEHELVAEHAVLEGQRMLKMQSVAQKREAHLNATYLQTFLSAKRKLGTLQSRLERQTQASERLESQVERLSRELTQVKAQLHETADALTSARNSKVSQTQSDVRVSAKDVEPVRSSEDIQDISDSKGAVATGTPSTVARDESSDDPYAEEVITPGVVANKDSEAAGQHAQSAVPNQQSNTNPGGDDIRAQVKLAVETEARACDRRVAEARVEAKSRAEALEEELSELKKKLRTNQMNTPDTNKLGFGVTSDRYGIEGRQREVPGNSDVQTGFGGRYSSAQYGNGANPQQYEQNSNYRDLQRPNRFVEQVSSNRLGGTGGGDDTRSFVGGFGGGVRNNVIAPRDPPQYADAAAYNSRYSANMNHNSNGFDGLNKFGGAGDVAEGNGAYARNGVYGNINNRQPIPRRGWDALDESGGGSRPRASGGGVTGWQQLEQPCVGKAFEYNTARRGQEYATQIVSSARRCRAYCMEDMQCHAWTYRKAEGRCGLMYTVEFPAPAACCVSGVKC